MHDFYSFNEHLNDRRRNKYAVVMFLPSALDNVIAPFREQYDPIYSLIASHLTLVFPFETSRPLDELTNLIKVETANQKSLLVELDSIGDFYPEFPIVYWSVKKNSELSELYYRLYAQLGLPIQHKQFSPHVTIAREISNHRLMIVKEKIVPYLPQEKFYATSLDLITPLVNNKWVSVRTFPFKGFGSHQ